MWAGIGMMLPSINAVNASGIKSMATDVAVSQGMGKGEFYTCCALSFPATSVLLLCRQHLSKQICSTDALRCCMLQTRRLGHLPSSLRHCFIPGAPACIGG